MTPVLKSFVRSFAIVGVMFMFVSCGTVRPVSLAACQMSPPSWSITLSTKGWADCVESGARQTDGSHGLRVSLDGPHGSGRYWTVQIVSRQLDGSVRGACVDTSTVGWRTLQSYPDGALPWLKDLNGDEYPEVIIWASFALTDEPSQANSGLFAWVFDRELDLDLAMTRSFARQLTAIYRQPVEAQARLVNQRRQASDAINAFVSGECRITP